jgi:hypothetical protein
MRFPTLNQSNPLFPRTLKNIKLHIVVSHCSSPLDRLPDYLSTTTPTSITIISKCKIPIIGAPKNSKIVEWSNVGRCDHSYAKFMAEMVDGAGDYDVSDVVVFLKDTTIEGRTSYVMAY